MTGIIILHYLEVGPGLYQLALLAVAGYLTVKVFEVIVGWRTHR